MGVVHVTYYTDPACPWSWAAEPGLRRLRSEFAATLEITYVMGGPAREFRRPLQTMHHVLDACAASAPGMPVDPRVWLDGPPRSSYPACRAVKAAAELWRLAAESRIRADPVLSGELWHLTLAARTAGPRAAPGRAGRAAPPLPRA